MEKIKISNRLSLSRIVQGFWRLTNWNYTTDELIRFMHTCIDMGITTFDTAEIYGRTVCETLMGKAFKKDPTLIKRIELVTKTGIFEKEISGEKIGYYNTRYSRVMQSCKESITRLGIDKIDLYLIHREDPCFNPWDTGRALEELQKEGLVLEIGVSNFDPFKFEALNAAVNGKLVTNQIEWNPICFEHFNSGMIDYLAMKKLHPMIWSPLAGGKLFDNSCQRSLNVMKKVTEIAKRHNAQIESILYAWILYHPVEAIPISGSRNVERIKRAVKGLDIKLDHAEWYELYTASGQQTLR